LTTENERLQNEINFKDQKYLELEKSLKESQELEEIALAIVCSSLLLDPYLSPLCLSLS
jgi:hypothetical protein